MKPKWEDPIIEKIRKYRNEYAAQFNFDIDAIYQDIKEKEKQRGRPFVTLSPKRVNSSKPDKLAS